MTFISFPKISQFDSLNRTVAQRTSYKGKDENGEAIYDGTIARPKLTFRGSVKVHGTNAAITLMPDGTVLAQSRSKVLVAPDDNFGFRNFVDSIPAADIAALFGPVVKAAVLANVPGIAFVAPAPPNDVTVACLLPITIYGEWAGLGVQKGVATNLVPKFFYIFAARIGDTWLDIKGIPELPEARVFNSTSERFPSFSIDIDFEDRVNVANASNEMGKITEAVEKECPVGKAFGVTGIGEGVVWVCTDPRFADSAGWYKVKGALHSSSEVTTLAPVDVTKAANIGDFIKRTVTENRLRQGIAELKEQGKPITVASTGDYLRWVTGDVLKEEAEAIVASGLTSKDVGSSVGPIARKFFFSNLEG